MTYKSFANTKRKIITNWDDEITNEKTINNNLKKFDLSYRPSQNFKGINLLTIIDDELVVDQNQTYSFELEGLDENLIPYFKPLAYYRLDSAYDITQEIDSFFTANAEGTLKNGDISVLNHDERFWWVKETNKWIFYYRVDFNVRYAIVYPPSSFGTEEVPIYLTLKLAYVDERFFDEIQSGK